LRWHWFATKRANRRLGDGVTASDRRYRSFDNRSSDRKDVAENIPTRALRQIREEVEDG
jgi:hypothetical protein